MHLRLTYLVPDSAGHHFYHHGIDTSRFKSRIPRYVFSLVRVYMHPPRTFHVRV
jgi:hypothetical protein